jgi:hypothetical protein
MKRVLSLIALGCLLAPALAHATVIDINATDARTQYTSSDKVINTFNSVVGPPAAEGKVLSPSSIAGGTSNNFHLEMVMNGTETATTVGTQFVGTPDAVPDIWISDPNNVGVPYLTFDIVFINVSSRTPGTFGVVNFGGQGDFTRSDLILTGGSKAADFGGVGSHATILINFSNFAVTSGSTFSSNFRATAAYDIYVNPVPEPGTLLLLGSGLVALVLRSRKSRSK